MRCSRLRRALAVPVAGWVLVLALLAPLAPFALVSGAALAHGPQHHGARLVPFGHPVPALDFDLPALGEGRSSLTALRGRYVLLNFWATWCPPCVREMPSLERLARMLPGDRFGVLAVALDAEGGDKVRPFVARLGLTFPIALDPEGRVGDAYGARDLPTTFLIDPQGRVVAAGKGERTWDAPEMVEYLRELIAAAPPRG